MSEVTRWPGELIDFDPFTAAALADPYPEFDRSLERQPVFWSDEVGSWMVLRYGDVKEVLRRYGVRSAANAPSPITLRCPVSRARPRWWAPFDPQADRFDPGTHHARGISPGLGPRRVAALEAFVPDLVRRSIDVHVSWGGGTRRAARMSVTRLNDAVARDGESAGSRVGLPRELSSFVGREAELTALEERLEEGRLVTLTGAGGAGKSRLAVRTAARLTDRFAGIQLVELAPLTDGALVPATVAAALGLKDRAGASLVDTVADAVGDDELLLVMDNCEHLVHEVADVVVQLLERCGGISVLATSRQRFHAPGELVFPVQPLCLPPSDERSADAVASAEAVMLFVERARAAEPSFALTDDNAPAVAEICIRLDGIPLAIELAAARVSVLTPAGIATHLDERFDLLGGGRGGPARHQTLRALVQWSYDTLAEAERRLLAGLSVFRDGFDLAAAEYVAGSGAPLPEERTLVLLTDLVDRSLVQVRHDGEARYALLETIRAFAAQRLSEMGEEAADTPTSPRVGIGARRHGRRSAARGGVAARSESARRRAREPAGCPGLGPRRWGALERAGTGRSLGALVVRERALHRGPPVPHQGAGGRRRRAPWRPRPAAPRGRVVRVPPRRQPMTPRCSGAKASSWPSPPATTSWRRGPVCCWPGWRGRQGTVDRVRDLLAGAAEWSEAPAAAPLAARAAVLLSNVVVRGRRPRRGPPPRRTGRRSRPGRAGHREPRAGAHLLGPSRAGGRRSGHRGDAHRRGAGHREPPPATDSRR